MKLVIGIIKPAKLDDVRENLISAGITRITIHGATGHGRATKEAGELYRGQVIAPNLTPKVRLEIACNDDFVDTAVSAIIKGARTGDGELGDGKIIVMPMDDCIRIRTGERGTDAI